jgi:alpha-L-rhamnosidase
VFKQHHSFVAFIFILAVASHFISSNAQEEPEAVNLRTEYKTDPNGLDVSNPRLSWEMKSFGRNVIQSAYLIRAAPSENDLDDGGNFFWDSMEVKSDRSVHVEYKGPALASGQRVYWQVKIWDNDGHESVWSNPAFREMGLLNPANWKAFWIEPDLDEDYFGPNLCPYLRKEFTFNKNIKEARVYVTCHDFYELSINRKKVGDQLFTPGWTGYHKRLQYQVYDVTDHLSARRKD